MFELYDSKLINNKNQGIMKKVKVLFVCMGNICRSPTAEGVFKGLVEEEGLSHLIETDSAGTHSYHIGAEPDSRAQEVALSRGYDLSTLRGRQFVSDDFKHFDYVLAMDVDNYNNMQAIKPGDATASLHLFLEFATTHNEKEVPDPYYGGAKGFERVFDMVEDASRGLLNRIKQSL